jgi:hypothetical protein
MNLKKDFIEFEAINEAIIKPWPLKDLSSIIDYHQNDNSIDDLKCLK